MLGRTQLLEGTSSTFTHKAGALRTGERSVHTGHGHRDRCTRLFTLTPPPRHSGMVLGAGDGGASAATARASGRLVPARCVLGDAVLLSSHSSVKQSRRHR